MQISVPNLLYRIKRNGVQCWIETKMPHNYVSTTHINGQSAINGRIYNTFVTFVNGLQAQCSWYKASCNQIDIQVCTGRKLVGSLVCT